MASEMKAAFLTGRMQIEVRTIPIPSVPPGGMLIKVDSTGLCGSDINRIRYTASDEQRVLGHEVAGEVMEVDRGVTEFGVGDRVAIGHVHIPCMRCVYCRHGRPAMCRQFKRTKIEPGGYAEYVAVSADHLAHTVFKIPEGVSYAAATFIDPLACCLRGLGLSEVGAFDRVVVVGVGIMGLLFLQLLREHGAEALAVDISEARLQTARAFGARHVFNSSHGPVAPQVLAATQGEGADTVLLSFLNQTVLDDAIEYVRDGGNLCIFAPPVTEARLNVEMFGFFRRELHMVSSYSSVGPDLELALNWIASGKVEVERMITGETTLEGLQACVAALDEHQYKIIVRP